MFGGMCQYQSETELGQCIPPRNLPWGSNHDFAGRGCFRVVDLLLDDSPELITVDEQSDDQFMHTLGLRKADGPAHQPFDPRPQVDVLALDALHVLFPDGVLLGVHMALVGPPELPPENWAMYDVRVLS